MAVLAPTLPAAVAMAGTAHSSEHALPSPLGLAVESYNSATVRNDTTTLAALVSDDFLLVNSDASIQDKASYLADFAKPGFKVDPYVIQQPVYRVVGEAALTAGEIQLSWTQDGRRQGRGLRIAQFWVLKQDRWRLAYTQLTRLPE